ncbi:CPBP family intramembrane metalloprotease [Neolewinella aurantiaca]|uniref:CPBP family intramembrane metalloprotease n=1 Tax=Neolewinella aurantiaca TaxID=2602767 RepID=A0A5C7G0J3_9BACT|nr:CPBP family intramembrane glutamic endopeptidase [Neolewinella aurantiaca]TXF91723.1 CPBP family intramembrane metalloprotease [Neolewinella aurantiaca]
MKPLPSYYRTITVPERPARLFLAMLGAFLILALLVAIVGSGLSSAGLINLADIAGQTATGTGRQWLRFYLLLSNLLPFAGTAVLALIFVYRKQWWPAAGLATSPPKTSVAVTTFFFVCALPFVGWLAYLNLQVPLPEWMQRNEDNTDLLLKGILDMPAVPEFILTFITVAVTPAVGEELLLRGVVQRRILQPWFGSPHAAIWLAAILFSAMHLEFAGFAPRLLLGVLLGYAYYWSRSLWVPVGLHLLFNGIQVVVAYVSGDFNPDAALSETPPWWLGVGSLIVVSYIGWWANSRYGHQEVLAGTNHQ